MRRRFYVECAVAGLTGVLTFVTLISREWVEALTGWDPDGGSGALEWTIVGVLAATSVALSWTARREWRRTSPVAPAGG